MLNLRQTATHTVTHTVTHAAAAVVVVALASSAFAARRQGGHRVLAAGDKAFTWTPLNYSSLK